MQARDVAVSSLRSCRCWLGLTLVLNPVFHARLDHSLFWVDFGLLLFDLFPRGVVARGSSGESSMACRKLEGGRGGYDVVVGLYLVQDDFSRSLAVLFVYLPAGRLLRLQAVDSSGAIFRLGLQE